MTDPLLTLREVTKVFGGQRALDGVDLELRRGEVHALLGQNGSGKSTLIKILAGYHAPEPGAQATVRGRPLDLGSAAAAHAHGIRFIHQDPALVGSMSALDNLALGERYRGSAWLSARRERAHARSIFAAHGVHIDVDAPVLSLGPAQQTLVAIVRAVHHGEAAGGILVLDEPTASLGAQDKARIFDLVRRVRDGGGTVLYVTHHLQEVFDLADRVTVLRDGRRVATQPVAGLDHGRLVELIVGRPVGDLYPEPDPAQAHEGVALEVDDLRGAVVDGVSFRAAAGEIVGFVGLTGSGLDELLHLVFGARPRSGRVRVHGADVAASPAASIAAGLAFAPGDRKRLGATVAWPVRHNVTLPRVTARPRTRWLGDRAEARDVAPYLERFDVRPDDPEARFFSLSGGNQQKAVLARWIRCGARVFLFEEPTAGVDVGAREAIYDSLAGLARDGAALVLATSDFEEACALCDRVLILRDGRIDTTLRGAQKTVDAVMANVLRQEAAAHA